MGRPARGHPASPLPPPLSLLLGNWVLADTPEPGPCSCRLLRLLLDFLSPPSCVELSVLLCEAGLALTPRLG